MCVGGSSQGTATEVRGEGQGDALSGSPSPTQLAKIHQRSPRATHPPTLATHCRMNWIASSYFIPLSIRARATSTGALREQAELR